METYFEQSKPRRVSVLAIGVLALAILAAVGFFLVVPAWVVFLGAMAVRGHLAGRRDVRGRGLATAAVLVSGVAGAVGLAMMMVVAMGRVQERTGGRAICAANVRGIMQSMVVYAGDNNDAFPLVPYAPYNTVSNAPSGGTTGTKDVSAALDQYFAAPYPHAGNVQANLWILVLSGQVAPRQFQCDKDPFVDHSAVATTDKAGNYFNNFQNPKQLSYSVAYSWNADGKPGAWWRNTVDSSLPIIADMASMQGTGTPAVNLAPASAPADNRTWNSGNHGGDGQNVGFADAHAEFRRTPVVGQNNDNIYSMSGSPSKGPAQFGGKPAGTAAPVLTADKVPFDIIMLPVRNGTTGAM